MNALNGPLPNDSTSMNSGVVRRNNSVAEANQMTISTNLTDIVLRSIEGKKLGQISGLFQRGKIPLPTSQPLSSARPPWQGYPTTTSFIILLHVIFLYQFNKRRKRSHVSTNYHRVIQRRRFHELWLAALSHPPLPPTINVGSVSLRLSLPSWIRNDPSSSEQRSWNQTRNHWQATLYNTLKDLAAACRGPWAGLVLLEYNTHLIWSARALETATNLQLGPLAFVRMLLALLSCSILLELGIDNVIVQSFARLNAFDPQLVLPAQRREWNRKLTRRSIGTCTGLATALTIVFQHEYERVPILVLPFVPNPGILLRPGWSLFPVLALLLILSRNTKSGVLSVWCGMWVGLFWSTGWLSFLAEAYWGNCWIVWLGIATILSHKANYSDWLPCIDFVAWDQKGYIPGVSLRMELFESEGETMLMERSVASQNGDDEDESTDEDVGVDSRRNETHTEIELASGSDDVEHNGRLAELDEGDNDPTDERNSLIPPSRRHAMRSRNRRIANSLAML